MPCLSDVSNFVRGTGDLFVTGTAGVVGLSPIGGEAGIDLRYLLGVLNSDVLSVCVTTHSPPYQGGYRKFSAPYLMNLPIPVPRDASQKRSADRIVGLVDDIETINLRLAEVKTASPSPSGTEAGRRSPCGDQCSGSPTHVDL